MTIPIKFNRGAERILKSWKHPVLIICSPAIPGESAGSGEARNLNDSNGGMIRV